MARTESESIYLDLRAFLKEARKAGYEMEARNRVDYIVPLSNALRECIRVFIRCHKERDAVRKFALVEQLDTEFTIARTEFHTPSSALNIYPVTYRAGTPFIRIRITAALAKWTQ